MRRVLAALLAAALSLAWATPAAADEPSVDLYLIATLDQPAYLAGDDMTATVTVVNSGTAPATGVVIRSTGDLTFTGWGEFDETGPGIDLAAGASVDLVVHAKPNDTGAGMTQQLEAVSAEPDADPAGNKVTLSAFVTEKQADLTVTIYGDEDRDGALDPGETRKGVEVRLFGGLTGTYFTTRTDDDGVAHFPGIPGGQYWPEVKLPKGWYVDPAQLVRVRGGTNTAVLRADLVDLSALSASITLDRAVYAPGDTVRERVTLTNRGATDIPGVVANCGGIALDNVLYSIGWGELDPNAPDGGALVRAGETRTWEFTDVVPPFAWDYGFLLLQCDFSPKGGSDGPAVSVRAAVPGGRGTIAGTLVDVRQAPIAGVTMRMLTSEGQDVARVESDATGRFVFPELPADRYELRATGPWRLSQSTFMVQVMSGQHLELTSVVLEKGEDNSPVVPTPRVAPHPPPVTRKAPHPAALADTGADVADLTALGALLVVLGLLLMRRRAVS